MLEDALSAKFAALADPTRRAILARLARGETSVSELAAPFDMSMPAVSKHLKVLESAGLISRGREAQWRPCKLEPQALKSVDQWLDDYRQLWEERFDRLDDYLRELQAEKPKAEKQARVSKKKAPKDTAKEKSNGRRKKPR
jgi:DNA-binding transcriptional ArsR family regulator